LAGQPACERGAASGGVFVKVGHFRIPQVILWEMALQIAGIVKDPHNVDRVFATAVDEKMPGLSDSSQIAPRPEAAKEQVICPYAARQISSLSRSGPLRVGRDIANRLLQKIPVAGGRALAKSF
jgi:hypothetical protein